FAAHLKRFQDVFLFLQHNGVLDWHITLHPTLKSPEDRTSAVANVIKCLGKELVPGIRNELFPVTTCFGTQALFSLERAAAPYFGI
ncbi:Nudix hydrolase 20 chloroplastic, partial [Bienertia sinuspersici]